MICPEDKLQLETLKIKEGEEGSVGEKIVEVGRVKFLISLYSAEGKVRKRKASKSKRIYPLPCRRIRKQEDSRNALGAV